MKPNIEARYEEGVYEPVVGDFPIRHMNQVKSPEDLAAYKRYRKFVHARWYAKPENAAKLSSKNDRTLREKARLRYHAMTPAERKALRDKRYAIRRAKMEADPVFYADALAKDNARIHRWRHANEERWNAYGERRRSMQKPDPTFIAWLRAQPCLDCGKPPQANRFRKSEVGHLIPIRRGGTNSALNLIAQCRSCNGKQHARAHPKFAMVNYPQAVAHATAAA